MERFKLPKIEYSSKGLPPFLSPETMEFHYGKHHSAYVTNLNKLLADSPLKDKALEEIVKKSEGGLYNNAAQAWNHTFYWDCLTAKPASVDPSSEFVQAVKSSFGSMDGLKEKFVQSATTLFGSGWTWLVLANGKLEVVNSGNAGNPLKEGKLPLLVCDVWEHAYYIDYRNARPKYLSGFYEHINWGHVENTFKVKDVSFVGKQME